MPSKISELALKTLVGTDQIPVSADGASNSNRILASDFLPITESVTKTVAADGMPAGVQDFDTFHEAMTWVCAQQTVSEGKIILSLEDGDHYIDPIDEDWVHHYTIYKNILEIKSASLNQSLCNIKLSNVGETDINQKLFVCNRSEIYIHDVTIDIIENTYRSKVVVFFCRNDANLISKNCTITGGCRYGFEVFDGSRLSGTNISIYGGGTGYMGIALSGPGAFGYFWGTTIVDGFDYGLYCSYCSGHANIGTLTVTNCNIYDIYTSKASNIYLANPNVSGSTRPEINKIHNDGSFITDETLPLVQAESYGTTAERPDPVQDGFNYFDSTLGKPIWYDGTNWVDATGATV